MSSTPSIRISQHQRFQGPDTYPPFSAASPMAIPRARQSVPPPLPPPTYIPELSAGQDPGWQWGNDPNGADFGRAASVKPGSSLLGSAAKSTRQGQEQDSAAQYPFDDARRGSSISTVTLGRDYEMRDETLSRGDDDASSSRPSSNGYVNAFVRSLVEIHVLSVCLTDNLASSENCTDNLRFARGALWLTILQF